jgi:hypothetical protein
MNFEGLSGELTLSDFTDHISNFAQNFSTAGVKSFGMAIDAGIEWLLMDEQLKLSAGVTDLGWTTWSDQNSFCATIDNVGYAFQGFDFKAGEAKFEKPENIAIQTPTRRSTKRNSSTPPILQVSSTTTSMVCWALVHFGAASSIATTSSTRPLLP